MKTFTLKRGLDVPILGAPNQEIRPANPISHVAVIGDDFIGMKPTMAIQQGERVKTGQLLFTDKKNSGVKFTSPGTGIVESINRGEKRKFESLIITLEDEEKLSFLDADNFSHQESSPETIRELLIESGLWCALRTRPYGKIPAVDSHPSSLFVTAMDTAPLAASPEVVIEQYRQEFHLGLTILQKLVERTYLCVASKEKIVTPETPQVDCYEFHGPHPAGLPSTHIHFLDPADENKVVWHIGYFDVISIGYLFQTGTLLTERIISLAGPAVKSPALLRTRWGASLEELCSQEVVDTENRLLSGSILDGRKNSPTKGFLGFYHQQVSVLQEGSGRSAFGWAHPGNDRFSIKPIFVSALDKARKFAMRTALWGGKRAIYPLGTYELVMPLDLVAIYLLKSLAVGDTEKAKTLGCLELIEEDLALCSYVCPGKNNFGPMLRNVLTEIELEG